MQPLEPPVILIVEDDQGTATLQTRAVERAGYRTLRAPTAEQALEILRGGGIALVLLDNRLPGERTGLDVLTSIRAAAPDVPVIMVTGSEGAVLQALRSGARDFVRKDIHYLDYLPRAIEQALRSASLEAQLRGDGLPPQRGVLVLDSEASEASQELRALEKAGLEAFSAVDVSAALRLLGENNVGLLVIDHRPRANGIDAYARIRSAGHDLPAILLGPLAEETTVIAALRAGFQDFVPKTGEYLGALQEAAHRVSERARMNAQVAESKARLSGIVNSALDAILLLDEDLRISMINPAAEQLFKVAAAEVAGEYAERLIPGIKEQVRPCDSAAESAPVLFEAVGRPFGSKPVDLELAAARMETGGRVFINVFARDVSRRKELERLLLQNDKLESLGLLAGGIAHDFNNLLVGIMGNASLALEAVGGNNPARSMLKDIVQASETAGNLTRQLLAYAGKGRFIIEPVDVSDLVRQIANLLQTSISKNVQLRLELGSKLPCVEADASQIQQLVMNLVINGAEAIGQSNGSVLITTGAQHVDQDYIATVLAPAQIRPGEYVNLQVHDTGSGMSPETIDKIFDPFFTTKFAGRGLGLAAVLGIVRGHKGAIKVYSTVGQGTTFSVLFPATDQHALKPAATPAVEGAKHGETILVVDDENIVRRTAKAMLERYGYAVLLAENGQQAIDLYKAQADKIDLVLLDMTMPVMGGEETFRAMKTIRPDVRVILSSGYNEVEAVRRFTGKGLAGFLQKPYSASSLAERVRAVLGPTPRGAAD